MDKGLGEHNEMCDHTVVFSTMNTLGIVNLLMTCEVSRRKLFLGAMTEDIITILPRTLLILYWGIVFLVNKRRLLSIVRQGGHLQHSIEVCGIE